MNGKLYFFAALSILAVTKALPVVDEPITIDLEVEEPEIDVPAEEVIDSRPGQRIGHNKDESFDLLRGFLEDKINEKRKEDGLKEQNIKITLDEVETEVEDGIHYFIKGHFRGHQITAQVVRTDEHAVQDGIPAAEDIYELVQYAMDAETAEDVEFNMHYPPLGLLDINDPVWAELDANAVDVEVDEATIASLPESYDARQQWPQCKWLNAPRNQGSCGSCWAFAGALVYSTQLCVASRGASNIELSTQDATSCTNVKGCSGGYPQKVWTYMETGQERGLVDESFYPYKAKDRTNGAECGAHKPGGIEYHTLKGQASKRFTTDEAKMAEIMRGGAMAVCYTVYSTFNGRGVYKDEGTKRGGHATALIGWGVEADGTKYWLSENSWGARWGDKGYFKMIRGANNFANSDTWCPYSTVPEVPKENMCQNGGSMRADETCECKPGTSGPKCETCSRSLDCQNGGTRKEGAGCDEKCECPAGFFGHHCDGSYSVSCSAGTASWSQSSGDALFKMGDIIAINEGSAGCDGETVLRSARVKATCGDKRSWPQACPERHTVDVGAAGKAGAVCMYAYLGVNEFGNDKGHSADGVLLGVCGNPAPATPSPTPAPTPSPTQDTKQCLVFTSPCSIKNDCSNKVAVSVRCKASASGGYKQYAGRNINVRMNLGTGARTDMASNCDECTVTSPAYKDGGGPAPAPITPAPQAPRTPAPRSPVTPAPQGSDDGACADKRAGCKRLKDKGYCGSNYGTWGADNCARTCGACGDGNPPCEDWPSTARSCGAWAAGGSCSKDHIKYDYCPMTCGVCGGDDSDRDAASAAPQAAPAGGKTCSQLGWGKVVNGVCCDSEVNGECRKTDSHAAAAAACASIGARLCTAAELNTDVCAGTGCGFDGQRVWTGESCGSNQFKSQGGRADYARSKHPEQCTDASQALATRCCSNA